MTLKDKESVDEFLIEKNPLSLPPEFEKLPEPTSDKSGEVNKIDKDIDLKKVFDQAKNEDEVTSKENSSSNLENQSLISLEEMILTQRIQFKNFKLKNRSKNIKNKLNQIIKQKNENDLLRSLGLKYKNSYSKRLINKYKKNKSQIRLIGMGGSVLGQKLFIIFLKKKLKKYKFY